MDDALKSRNLPEGAGRGGKLGLIYRQALGT